MRSVVYRSYEVQSVSPYRRDSQRTGERETRVVMHATAPSFTIIIYDLIDD
jgi:hypothetical protein